MKFTPVLMAFVFIIVALASNLRGSMDLYNMMVIVLLANILITLTFSRLDES